MYVEYLPSFNKLEKHVYIPFILEYVAVMQIVNIFNIFIYGLFF